MPPEKQPPPSNTNFTVFNLKSLSYTLPNIDTSNRSFTYFHILDSLCPQFEPNSRIANIRKDFTHKLTTRLVRENQAIGIEDLCVKGMVKNHNLAQEISDVGFSEIRRQLEYKSVRYGTTLVIADRWFPSSKMCSRCDYRLPELSLSVREWICPECGTYHDRDVNAAKNLKRLATFFIGFANEQIALPVANLAVTSGT